MYRILTDKAEVVTRHYVWDGHLDTSVGQLEAVGDNNWCLNFTGPQKDEGAVVVCDLGGLRRKVPERRTSSGPSHQLSRKVDAYHVTLCLWPEYQVTPARG